MTKPAPWSWLLLYAAIAVSAGIWVQLGGDPPLPSNSGDDAVDARVPAGRQATRSDTAGEGDSLSVARKARETGTAAVARHAELAAMSETFRDGVFLIAIREAGYLCYQLIDSSTSGGDEPIWAVTCDDALRYVVGVDPTGAVIVEPMPIGDGAREWQVPEGQFPDPSRSRLPIE